MNFILRLITLFLLLCFTNVSFAEQTPASQWWKEKPYHAYYYISLPTTSANLKAFYGLVLYHGWQIDISGMSASTNIMARLVKKSLSKKGDDKPFPEDRSWYEKVLFRSSSHISFKITGDMSSQITFINSMIEKGYKQGFMKADTPAFTQVITFYR